MKDQKKVMAEDQKRLSKFQWKMSLAYQVRWAIQYRVKRRSAGRISPVSYGFLMKHFGLDRFTLAEVLDLVVFIDVYTDSPFWSSWVVSKKGEVGAGFLKSVRYHWYDVPEDEKEDFVERCREECLGFFGIKEACDLGARADMREILEK